METNHENPWKITGSHVPYENAWIKVTHHDVINAAGNNGIYGTVHFKNYAIGIIALDEQANTWIVGQYRFPFNEYTWEIPEGGGALNQSPLESAKRELLEETGIMAKEWRMIQQLQLSNSATDEVAFLFLATNLSHQQAAPEEGEVLTQKKISFEALYQMVKSGELKDSLTVAAVLKIKLMHLEGEIEL